MKQLRIKTPAHPAYAPFYRITAETGGKEVGHVYAYIIGDLAHDKSRKKYYCYVHDLRVDEEARGKGIGRKLMRALNALAKKKHCYKIVANSHRKRKAARALYMGMGFLPHGREFRFDL